MAEIVLTTLNARYIHASLGLRYLRANLGEHRDRSVLLEFTIKRPLHEIVQEILQQQPRVVGFGVYIWNTTQTLQVVQELKRLQPSLVIVAGGPEISYETESQELHSAVDVVFRGEADFTFRNFIATYLETGKLPAAKIVAPQLPEITQVVLPYSEYTDEDVRHRTIYVEASRGCPYKCEYCLSALDVSVRNFHLETFLDEMKKLLERGVRQFKFVDRTFNLAPTTSTRILNFFLEHIDLGLFLHFEMVPDRLPQELQSLIRQFPAGSLQFEIGIQTWSPEVARNVSRRQNYQKISENFRFLRQQTKVHTHADLIIGLPGETWESFAHGFNELVQLDADEIQVGLLKRLKGTPIVRHDEVFAMKYSTEPPFQILENKHLSAQQIHQLKVFADFWDLIANSGRFPNLKDLQLHSAMTPFQFYYDIAQALFANFGRTHSIHLVDLERALMNYLSNKGWSADVGLKALRTKVRDTSSNMATPSRQAHHLN